MSVLLNLVLVLSFVAKAETQSVSSGGVLSSFESSYLTEDPSKSVPEIEQYEKQVEHKYSLFTYKRTYLVPLSYVDKTSQDIYGPVTALQAQTREPYYQNLESEFQISFFVPFIRKLAYSDWDLNLAYTHHSWWQVYNSSWSKPFRETNYSPELFFRYLQKHELKIFGLKLLSYDLGYIHQSNGQIQALSRSWDRLYARASLSAEDLFVTLEAWARMPELGKDENSGILRFMGLGKVSVQKNIGVHSFELQVPVAEYISLDFSYSYPWKDGFRWFASYRAGSGHSLIEYDRSSNRVGLGLALDNFFDARRTEVKK